MSEATQIEKPKRETKPVVSVHLAKKPPWADWPRLRIISSVIPRQLRRRGSLGA